MVPSASWHFGMVARITYIVDIPNVRSWKLTSNAIAATVRNAALLIAARK